MRLWLWLINKLKCKKQMTILIMFKVINVCLGLLFALWMKKTIDDIYVGSHLFAGNAFIFILIVLSQLGISAIIYYLTYQLELSIDKKLKSMMFTTVLNEDYQIVSSYHSGELMNRYSSDLSKLSNAISRQIPNMISMIIRIIAVVGVISFISPVLSVLLCVGGIIFVVISLIVKKVLKPLSLRVNFTDDTLKSQVQESLESLLVIHSFHNEQSILDIHQTKLNDYIHAQTRKAYIMNILETSLSAAIQCAYLIGFLWCVYKVMNNQLSIGSISAVISLIGQIKNPFVGISTALPQLIVLSTHIDRIKDLITDYKINSKEDSAKYYTDLKEICIDHISFSYDDKDVLNDFSLSISKGETVALVGYSGAGKTTLLKLLMNIYSIDQGSIYLRLTDDCINITDIGYGLMTYVPQDYGLMSGSIYETVAFGCKDIDKDRVVWACQKACIHNEIIQLKQGYNTILKEHGQSLSGGQMQRLSLARAIYSDCPIMLLDEVTSSLHPDLEQDIIKSLKSLDNKTIIIVTHRKEVLDICDRIVDFDEVI